MNQGGLGFPGATPTDRRALASLFHVLVSVASDVFTFDYLLSIMEATFGPLLRAMEAEHQ